MKSQRSIRSIKSTRSLRTSKAHSEVHRHEIVDLENVLPIACAKFDCSYTILVKKTQRNDDFYKSLKHADYTKKRISMSKSTKQDSPATEAHVDDNESTTETETSSIHINSLTVTSVYDTYNCLTEIRLDKPKQVPRILMQVLGFLLPYYKNVTRMTVSNCKLDAYTIYEMSKIIIVSTITQVCLDGTSIAQGHYTILLDTSNLKYFSLSRCNINDDVCDLLASKLQLSKNGEKLSLLNLSSNHITDAGARSLGDALRTNRYLRYLNIADNHITDDGALSILRVLMEFPLTYDEILKKRERYYTYLRKKQGLYLKYINAQTSDDISYKAKRKKTSATSLKAKSSARKEKDSNYPLSNDEPFRAEILVKQILGPFMDPFQPDSIICKNGVTYCLGNMALAYLNLSYNDLTYLSMKSLRDVVSYQKGVVKKITQTGLIKVIVEGNNLPIKCPEMSFIGEALSNKNQEMKRGKAHSKVGI